MVYVCVQYDDYHDDDDDDYYYGRGCFTTGINILFYFIPFFKIFIYKQTNLRKMSGIIIITYKKTVIDH